MNPDRWSEVENLYHAVVEREPAERVALLSLCPDEEVRREVESLLAHEHEGEELLEHPRWSLGSPASLPPRTRWGPYEITERIGAGGMGEVYRARDSKLGRNVALKVLPEEFNRDADRMARLKREARVLASLNHPNIAAIYGLEESDGACALAMELVEGPTLAERIGKRAMPREKVLSIAKQVVEALEYAHEKGIVHRDLKPANIKLTAEGKVKLLDFGLAKTLENSVALPTETAEATRSGVVMGTAAYMSPEQAQGKPVDQRTDIWAFGVVLCEMLTGEQVFKGESTAEVLAAVIKEEPNLDALPAGIRRVVGRCLRKDPHERWHSISDVQIALEEAAQPTVPPVEQARPRPSRVLGFGLAALLVSLGALGFWLLRRSSPGALPSAIPVTIGLGRPSYPSFSPDGKHIAYSWEAANEPTSNIYVKLAGSETELRVTAPPAWDQNPEWSPDGKWIAFYRTGVLHPGYYLVSALGGPVRQILAVTASWPTTLYIGPSVAWFPDSRHVALSVPPAIISVDIESGEQKRLTDAKDAQIDFKPEVSPDGKVLAFVRVRVEHNADVYLADLGAGTVRPLTDFKTAIWGITWTADGRELVFSINRNGLSELLRMPVHGGVAQRIASSPASDLRGPAISIQGNRLAYVDLTCRINLWRTDISAANPPAVSRSSPLMSSDRCDGSPAYSPDGQKVAFASNRSGSSEIWEAAADGSNPIQLSHTGGSVRGSPCWSPDGSAIAFDSEIEGKPEIMVLTEEGRRVRQITNDPAENVEPNWSKDGRWIYFSSNRNGDFQIYKIRSDQAESASNLPVQVTTRGGAYAAESPDGKYLYYARGRTEAGGLWRRRLEGASREDDEVVLASLPRWDSWAVTSNGIFFLESEDAKPWNASHFSRPSLKFLNLRSKQITDLRKLEYPSWGRLAVSPDGLHVVYGQWETSARLVMIENFK